MKTIRKIYPLMLLLAALSWAGCKESGNYPGGDISPYIPLYDLRTLYKGTDLSLTKEVMFGSTSISAVVISDHSGNNLPKDLLYVQDKRRLSQLRGIAIPIGDAAANYVPGDSVIINIEGGILKRVDGVLQVTNVPASAVTKVASGVYIPPNGVHTVDLLADPDRYESTLIAIVKGSFNPLAQPGDTFAGNKTLNDGFGNAIMKTDATATFANSTDLPFLANYYGIVINTKDEEGKLNPFIKMRTMDDVQVLSSEISIPPVLITGFINDVKGTDANYEYVQCIATQDINFATTPFSLVTTNNAGASTPTGYPSQGWATGDVRTYKINMTSGSVHKGQFFYVGGTGKRINASKSTKMDPPIVWIGPKNYSTNNGYDFGTKTSNLLANGGNAFGMAIFKGTTVTEASVPVDVVFVGGGGTLYTPGPPAMGYRICNNDFYDIKDPLKVDPNDPEAGLQPFYRSGTNTLSFKYTTPSNLGYFYILGGEYSLSLGRWTKARSQLNPILNSDLTADISEIENENSTKLVE